MTIRLCEKRTALLGQAGHLLALGGPGSGKTTIALLKAQRAMQAFCPGQEVLFLSFSRAAVQQILQRCRSVLTADERRRIQVQTYHSFCLDLLVAHGRLLSGKRTRILFPGEERLRKAGFGAGWDAEKQRLAVDDSVYCFDMLAPRAADLMQQSAATRSLIADRYPLIIVDEFQDTDDAQWCMVEALAGETTVFCLADPDQRIFEYQASIDPQRVEKMKAALSPTVFDFAGENNRSSGASGILQVADAILRNRGPLPATRDVSVRQYQSYQFEGVVHAAVLHAFSTLSARGVSDGSVAVLARTNQMVARISAILSETRTFGAGRLPAVDHEVVWDAELSLAAAVVIASVLTWPGQPAANAVSATLSAAEDFFKVKGGETASRTAETALKARQAIAVGRQPRSDAAKKLLASHAAGLTLTGRPVEDWLSVRGILKGCGQLEEIFKESRLVRLFRAGDTLAGLLDGLWLQRGSYEGAPEAVKRALEREQLLGGVGEPSGCVLMSMHKSKGKEFDAVVIIEGEHHATFFNTNEPFPYMPSRRLLRVGITRAKTYAMLVRPYSGQPLYGTETQYTPASKS